MYIYIYIYLNFALCASLYIGIYTYICAIYAQSKPWIHIYMGAIYIFAAFVRMLICILPLAYMCLCMLQAVILHQLVSLVGLHLTLFLSFYMVLQVSMRWKTSWMFMCINVVTSLPTNTWSSSIDTALLNLCGNLHQISLVFLTFFPLFKITEGCIWPMEGGDIRFCWCATSFEFFLVPLMDRFWNKRFYTL